MNRRLRVRRFARAVILLTLAVCLAIAAWRYGGVNATDWQYLAIPMSLASLGAFFVRSRRSGGDEAVRARGGPDAARGVRA